MIKPIKLSCLLLAVLLTGCEFESYEDYSIPPYNGELTFTNITKKASWENRYEHATTVYDGKIWLFGGYNPGAIRGDTYYEDVWASSDGEQWELILEKAPWHGRKGHRVVTFNDGNGDAMYLVGGFEVNDSTGYRQYTNDVWKSNDGKTWQQIKKRVYPEIAELDTASLLEQYDSSLLQQKIDSILLLQELYDKNWFPRMDHAVVTANHDGQNYMYIIGGRTQLEDHNGTYAQKYFSDVWRSADGVTWDRLPNNNFGRRASHAAAVDPNTGTIYIQGGNYGIIFDAENNASQPIEDWMYLWSSPDGINWTSHYDSIVPVNYTQRKEHEMVFYQNKLWIFPGATTSTMHYMFGNSNHYPTWTVDQDGIWGVDSEGSDLRGRHSYATAVFNDEIFFLGGFTSNLGQNNDVWTAALE